MHHPKEIVSWYGSGDDRPDGRPARWNESDFDTCGGNFSVHATLKKKGAEEDMGFLATSEEGCKNLDWRRPASPDGWKNFLDSEKLDICENSRFGNFGDK